jgi:tRNA threonylcarbamoyladenosine modification (KEOPS) complex  Pcc1 subunit
VAEYRLSLRSDAEARVLAETLRIEAEDSMPRASVNVASNGAEVTIRVEAEDASALRAASKSFLSWAKGAVQSMRFATAPRQGPGNDRRS